LRGLWWLKRTGVCICAFHRACSFGVISMGDLLGPQHRTLSSRQSVYRLGSGYEDKYFCGPGGVARRLRYSSITMPVNPRRRSNRDRVKLLRNTLLWGICAFAAFQLSPPLERSMANSSSGRPDHYFVQVELFVASSIPELWLQPFTHVVGGCQMVRRFLCARFRQLH
jgi:hypothetical protein